MPSELAKACWSARLRLGKTALGPNARKRLGNRAQYGLVREYTLSDTGIPIGLSVERHPSYGFCLKVRGLFLRYTVLDCCRDLAPQI